MTNISQNKPIENETNTAQTNTNRLIGEFAGSNANYYVREFTRIGNKIGYVFSFNHIAAIFGSIWFGIRGLWTWFLPSVVLEAFGIVQVTRGVWGNLAAPFLSDLAKVEKTLATRYEQLAAVKIDNPDKVPNYERLIASLESSAESIKTQATAAEATAIWLILSGVAVLLLVKIAQGLLANKALSNRFNRWRSDRALQGGVRPINIIGSVVLALLTYITCVIKFGFPEQALFLNSFPTDIAYQNGAATWIKEAMEVAAIQSEWFFDGLTYGIRTILDALETMFTQTPWPVMGGFIILLTGLSAGWRSAVFAFFALAYLGYLGFWDKSMKTLALLGTAAGISIVLGVPLGVLCARKARVYAFVRPVLDFMQTMPAFVYLIPIVTFFGTGKPAAIIATMIFGSSPVVRLTVLGLHGVPKSVREAAEAYGASKSYLLWKVDLPLAAPSIMAGINQTILLSLAMVVIAALIGAEGLGQEVLEALLYSAPGKGILAGLAILFCALILNRIVQGKRQ